MYRAFCAVYYPDQQMHNIYIDNILYIASTPHVSMHLHNLQGVFGKVTKIIKVQTQKSVH
jgi:hypothetical protein